MGKIKDFFKNYKTRKQLKAEIEELKKIPIIIPPIMFLTCRAGTTNGISKGKRRIPHYRRTQKEPGEHLQPGTRVPGICKGTLLLPGYVGSYVRTGITGRERIYTGINGL